MEHLHTFIISVFLAGLISFFIPASKNKSNSSPVVNITHNTGSENLSISSEIILSWLNSGQSYIIDQFDSLPIKQVNQLVVLDLPDADTPVSKSSKPDSSSENEDRIVLITPNFWEVVHSIESKQGVLLYRPRNKEKSCRTTSAPCGHYQISAQALKDINCNTPQCKIDRENPAKSLAMSQTLEKINLQRLAKSGYRHLPDYQKYLIHQQGATGIKRILDAQKGRYKLGKKQIRNMANNSSYSYKALRNMGSTLAAQQFLKYWENKWDAEIEMIYDEQLKQQMAIREYLQVASNTQVN